MREIQVEDTTSFVVHEVEKETSPFEPPSPIIESYDSDLKSKSRSSSSYSSSQSSLTGLSFLSSTQSSQSSSEPSSSTLTDSSNDRNNNSFYEAETFMIIEPSNTYEFRNSLNKLAGQEMFKLQSDEVEILVNPFTCSKHLLPIQTYTAAKPGTDEKVKFFCEKCNTKLGRRLSINKYIEDCVQKRTIVSLNTKKTSKEEAKESFHEAFKYYVNASKKAGESIIRNNEKILDMNKKITEMQKKKTLMWNELGIIMEESGVPKLVANQKLRQRVFEILETFTKNYEPAEIANENSNIDNEIKRQMRKQKKCVVRARLFREVLLDFPHLNNDYSRFAYSRLLEMGEVSPDGVVKLKEDLMAE